MLSQKIKKVKLCSQWPTTWRSCCCWWERLRWQWCFCRRAAAPANQNLGKSQLGRRHSLQVLQRFPQTDYNEFEQVATTGRPPSRSPSRKGSCRRSRRPSRQGIKFFEDKLFSVKTKTNFRPLPVFGPGHLPLVKLNPNDKIQEISLFIATE